MPAMDDLLRLLALLALPVLAAWLQRRPRNRRRAGAGAAD
jgi:flagellar biogenesis protein FliO